QQTKSLGERGAAFERADDERTRETPAGARAEGQIEVASASRGERAQPLDFVVVGLVEARSIQSSVAHAAENHSSGSSLRRLLLPTTPLTMTMTPAASANSMNRRRASVHVGMRRRSS